MILKILTVAGLATFEIYAAIPAGFAFHLPAWIIFLSALVGGLAGVFVSAFLGDRIRNYFSKNKTPKPASGKKHEMMLRIWNKYGIIGLGFFGTFTVGAPLSIAVGVGLNADIRKLVTWCCIGVFFRCLVFTAIGHFGLKML